MEDHNESRKNRTGPSGTGVKAMWGLSLSTLQVIYWTAVLVTAIAGGIGITSALISALVGSHITVVVQRESDERVAVAEQKAAEANLRAAEIEESIAPRRITKAKQLDIASRLKRFAGQTASLWYGAGDKESDTFALEIVRALFEAKWHVYAPASVETLSTGGREFDGSTSAMETGVTVSSPPNGISHDAGNALLQELIGLGFDATKLPDSRRSKSHGPVIIISVNVRPEGPQGEAKLRKQKRDIK